MTYVEPSRFFPRVKHEGMHNFRLEAGAYKTHLMEPVIDQLRSVNQKDPNFIWTCMCSDERTVWEFAYADQAVHDEADALAEKLIAPYRYRSFLSLFLDIPEPPHEACTCPFAGDN